MLAAVEMHEKRPKEAAEWLTRGVKATGGDPALLWTLADRLIDTNDFQEADQLIARLQAVDATRPIAQYLSARVLIAQSKWAEASRQLEAVGGDLKKWPQLDMRSQFLRAQCYTRLHLDDLAIVAYRAALEVNPDWMPARLSLAEALRARGQIDEAVVEFSRLSQLRDAPPQTSMNLLRLAVQQNLSKPPSERKRGWAEIDRELDKLIQDRPAADAMLLAAEVLVAEERIADARQMLRTAMKAHPTEPALWSALISLGSHTKRWDESERLLREMQERFGDSVLFRLTKAEYLVRRFGSARKRDLRALAELPASYSAMDRQSLAMGMARAAMAIQDYEQAERLWQTASDRDPTNLQLPLLLFDLASQRGRPEAMETALGKVRLIEGKDGPISRYGEAIQLVIQAKKQEDKASANALFDKALQQLGEASAHRANWSKTALLAAEINDSLGKPTKAVDKYLEAIELGERNPGILVKALKLMTDQKDDLRAGTLIRKLLDEKIPFSTELSRFATEAAVQANELDRALELAQTVADQSHDVRDRIGLARVAQLSGKPDKAEAEFRKATTLAPHDASAWVGLIQFYATTGKKEPAQQALDEMTKKVDRKQALVAFAYANQLVGHLREADVMYDFAAKSSPGDFEIRKRAIEFKFKQGRVKEAEFLAARVSRVQRSSEESSESSVGAAYACPVFGRQPHLRQTRGGGRANRQESGGIAHRHGPSRLGDDRCVFFHAGGSGAGAGIAHQARRTAGCFDARQSHGPRHAPFGPGLGQILADSARSRHHFQRSPVHGGLRRGPLKPLRTGRGRRLVAANGRACAR